MMGKREDAARALYERQMLSTYPMRSGQIRLFWDGLPRGQQEDFIKDVDAVIACIREPDEKMIRAAEECEDDSGWSIWPDMPAGGSRGDISCHVWRAMLSAIGD